ncbi:MAG: 2-aminoethylphosphonate--pyruvate transaminase [Propionibacteriaceae bacterium]|jgi:2-aminoethylphosphonate-pyruvate transaminase|nr:2-aminoethylphosphonate--pyruvate transaminase [Propionibacteriaceae bacterium]
MTQKPAIYERFLLTPGPLTTSIAVRQAALVDWGSWDEDFNALTAQVRQGLIQAAGAGDTLTCVPLQGSGTFAVEAAVRTFIPRNGGLVVAVNGAYGVRMARLAEMAGLRVRTVEYGSNEPINPDQLADVLQQLPGFTHVGVVHCETSTGLLNPLAAVADAVGQAGGRLLIDAMSTLGALEVPAAHPAVTAVVASSGKCLEGLPGVGFVFATPEALQEATGRSDSLSLDLAAQYTYMEATGQWRFTPPTHLVAALAAALREHEAEGGRAGRLARYQANSAALATAAQDLGLVNYLPAALQAPIIHTFFAPNTDTWSFPRFYHLVKQRGFILYPGKLTTEETFRVGCIGRVTPEIMYAAVQAIAAALTEMNHR